jgi:hypothetical protein
MGRHIFNITSDDARETRYPIRARAPFDINNTPKLENIITAWNKTSKELAKVTSHTKSPCDSKSANNSRRYLKLPAIEQSKRWRNIGIRLKKRLFGLVMMASCQTLILAKTKANWQNHLDRSVTEIC